MNFLRKEMFPFFYIVFSYLNDIMLCCYYTLQATDLGRMIAYFSFPRRHSYSPSTS